MKKLLNLFIAFFAMNQCMSSHMFGADMTYVSLGAGKYKIIVKAYRDCRGVSMSTLDFKAFAGINGGNGCGTVSPASLTRVSIRDVSTICSTGTKPCSPANTYGTGKGIEEHVFEAIVDFNSAPLNTFLNKSTCCEVTFYVNQCCRNGGITTGPANNDFYSTCMINICNIKKTIIKTNSSPFFSTEPVNFLCCNIPWYYNNGAMDTVDYDSISYKLVRALSNVPNTSVSYSSPFSFNYPMTPYCIPPTSIQCTPKPSADPPQGFFFDTSNGNFIVTPIKCDESPVIVIEQTEWRKDSSNGNWIVVGKNRRDMQLIVLDNCNYNKAPKIEGSFDVTITEGDKYCQKIKITDDIYPTYQTVPDTVIGKWNNGIPTATFTLVNKNSREKEYEFCWQTKIGDARPNSYQFTVTANDQHCSPPSVSSRAFKVKVESLIYPDILIKKLNCNSFLIKALNSKSTDSITWEINYMQGGKLIHFSNKTTDSIKLPKTDFYVSLWVKRGTKTYYSHDTIFNTVSTKKETVNACKFYYTHNQRKLISSGIYYDTVQSIASGCDSVVREIHLNITKVNDSIYYKFPYLYAADSSSDNVDWLDCNNGFKSVNPSAYDSLKFWPKNSGSYALFAIKNGCADTSDCFQITNNSIKKNQTFTTLLFPNPVKNELNIEGNQKITQIEISDITGKILFSKTTNQFSTTLNLSALSKGSYFIKLYNAEKQAVVHKIFKD